MQEFSAEGLGYVIRSLREQTQPRMSQEELAAKAGYGKGGAVSISRIERGLVRPGKQRMAGIARAVGLTPEQLADEAVKRTRETVGHSGQGSSSRLTERVAETKRRHARVTERVSGRAKATQQAAEAFNDVHDTARDQFFMHFVSLAETVIGAPEPKMPDEKQVETKGAARAEIRVEAMSAGIAEAIRGAAGGGVAGAAAGGAAAYGAFTAAAMFGTAGTGAAISSLSGVAATNATLALLGGGTLAAGGAGMAGGTLLLTGMVAAPVAALAAAGFVVLKHRRTKHEEERLREQVEKAEHALDQSQSGFDAMMDVLERATQTLDYVRVHGVHALTRWDKGLPPKPRSWDELGTVGQAQYEAFLDIAGCVLAISSINVSALLTAVPPALVEMIESIDDTLTYAEKTIKQLV